MNKKQTEELAKYSFDISKLMIGSWILQFFSQADQITRLLIMMAGLTLAAAFLILGMRLLKDIL